jgi:hypothetical protein
MQQESMERYSMLSCCCTHRVTHSFPETGRVPEGGEGGYKFSVSRFQFSVYSYPPPLRRFSPRPPVSGGQSAGAVCFSLINTITEAVPRTASVILVPSLQGGIGWVLCLITGCPSRYP